MTNGIAVLGLDALDTRLVDRLDCNHLQLERSGKLETFSYATEHPKTSEVWPTIATGVHPREHGLDEEHNAEWDSSFLQTAGQYTWILPNFVRSRLREFFTSSDDHSKRLPQTDHPHVFERGRVYEWPGIVDSPHFWAANDYESMDLSEQELREELSGHTGMEVGWLVETVQAGCPVAGVQCHILDKAGHTYAKDEAEIERYYRYMDGLVGSIRQRVDRLLIVSDHGMQTTVLDDPEPGVHSWDAHCAAQGLDGDLPEDAFEVRSFIEFNMTESIEESQAVDVDAPEEHLRDLGYLE